MPTGLTPPNKRTRADVYALLLATAEVDTNGCLLATKGQPTEGYRRINADGQQIMAHRLVYEIANGTTLAPWPAETIDHTCHNADESCDRGHDCPHRRCINPGHLEVVDLKTNWERGRTGAPAKRRAKTHCPKGHPYSGDNLSVTPQGFRVCKACRRAKARREREAARA